MTSLFQKIRFLLYFASQNFGPLLVFYLVQHFWGFKAGIALSWIWIAAESLWFMNKKQKPSSFFIFSSVIAMGFGILDLWIGSPIFFQYEAVLTQLLFAFFFGISLCREKSLIQEFAERQGRTSLESSIDKDFFFRLYTIVWTFYFLIKAAFYFWIAQNHDLESGLVLRFAIGNVSFWVLMFLSVGIPRWVWKQMQALKLFPSQRLQ